MFGAVRRGGGIKEEQGCYQGPGEELSEIKEEVVKVVKGNSVPPWNPPHTDPQSHTSSAPSDGLSLEHEGRMRDSEQYTDLLLGFMCVQRCAARFFFFPFASSAHTVSLTATRQQVNYF